MDFLTALSKSFSGGGNNDGNEQSQGNYGGPQQASAQHRQQQSDDGPGPDFKLPHEILQIIDKYVDTFQPGIAKGVADEIVAFEHATIQALEDHIKAAITGVFKGDFSEFQSNKNMNEFRAVREQPHQQYGANLPQYQYPPTNVVASKEGGSLPEYGSRGLPFAGDDAGGVAGLSAAAGQLSLSDGQPEPEKQKNIFEAALGKVKDFAKDTAEDIQDGVEKELKEAASKIGDIADHIDEKVAEIAPELKEKIGKILEELHLGLAEKMTASALSEVKKFLGGNINLEQLGRDAIDGVQDVLKAFTGHGSSTSAQSQSQDDAPPPAHGAAGVLSVTLAKGLTPIRNHSRGNFRSFLSHIEEEMFDKLPNGLQEILSKIFGGSPFDSDGNKSAAQQQNSGEKEGILEEITDKIKAVLERIQDALRDRVLEVVGGGHRRLEDKAWGSVQDAIVGKVQHYVPGVQVHLKDDDTDNQPQQAQRYAQQQYQQ